MTTKATPQSEGPAGSSAPAPGALLEAWAGRSLDEVIEHIIVAFHTPVLRDLARLAVALRSARRLFAPEASAGFEAMLSHFETLRLETEEHIFKEERVIFPALREGEGPVSSLFVMREEHAGERARLDELIRLLEPCGVPIESEAGWRSLCEEIQRFADVQYDHMRLENEVLLPRSLRER